MRKTFLACMALLLAGCSSTSTTSKQGPAQFRVKFETTKGDFFVDVVREWSPLGADQFHELVTTGFFEGARFFRVVPGFVVQFGLKGDPKIDAQWKDKVIADDPPSMTNAPATITFATAGPQTRTTQIFINLGNNARLDSQGFTPFGRVTEGMQVVANLYAAYGEQPDQGRITAEGNSYLQSAFPNLDYIRKASIVQ